MTHLLLLLLRSYSTLVQTVLLNLRITWYDCLGGEGDHEGPAIGMPTKSSLYSSLLTHSAGAYPGFHSRSVITPSRWDVTRLSWQLASTHVYSWEEREMHCESEVFCLRTQHVDSAWSRTQTSRPGLFHWPWGQCHRQHIQITFILLRWSVVDWFLSVSK